MTPKLNTFILRFTGRFELYHNIVSVPLAIYFVSIAGNLNKEKVIYFLISAAIAATIAMVAGTGIRVVRLKSILGPLKYNDADFSNIKKQILAYPKSEAIVGALRWIMGLALCYIILLQFTELSAMESIPFLINAFMVIPIATVIEYFTTENALAVYNNLDQIKSANLEAGSYRPVNAHTRTIVIVISILLIPLIIFGYLFYVLNIGYIQLTNLSMHILFVSILSLIAIFIAVYESTGGTRTSLSITIQTLENLAKGTYDVDKIPMLTTAEIGAISQNINVVANSLRKYQDQCDILTNNLEQKVEKRTIELEKANEKLKEIDRLKTNFFSNISHEIRTPLTLILSPVESVLQGDYDKEVDVKFFENIQRNALRLLRLVNNLLDYSKIEAGRMKVKIKETNLINLLQNFSSAVLSAAESKGISFSFNPSVESEILFLDIDLFEKIVMNVFSNALKFTDKGGSIDMRVRDDEKHCYIEIEDTGIGISSDMVNSIFERFSQVDSDSTRRHEGTGIGLSLTRELIEITGGSISVKSSHISESKEHGTLFTITIPKGKAHLLNKDGVEFIAGKELVDSISDTETFLGMMEMVDFKEKISTQKVPVRTNDSFKNILVVEDNPDMRDFLTFLLSDYYNIDTAVDGLEGLTLAKELKPDLIVTDVMMPRLNGYDLTRMIKEDDKLSCIPVIMLTAKVDISNKIEGIEYGADDYLTKPFNSKELLARVRSLLNTYELQQQLNELNKNLETKVSHLLDITKEMTGADNAISASAKALKYILEMEEKKDIEQAMLYLKLHNNDSIIGYTLYKDDTFTETPPPFDIPEDTVAYLSGIKEILIKDNTLFIPVNSGNRVLALLAVEGTSIKPDMPDSIRHFIEGIARSLALALDNLKAEENRRLANIGSMAASIVHDLKNTIGTIMGYTEMAGDECFSKEERHEFLEMVSDETRRLADMSNELLEFSRGEMNLEIQEIDADEYITTIKKAIAPLFTNCGIEFKCTMNCQCKLKFDSERILRVILNLAKNSAEAMANDLKEDSTFSLNISNDEKDLIIVASDNGAGIHPHIQATLFEPFVTHGKSNGTGLGMAIVKKIVTAHGGKISFESEPDKGTKFYIQLPLKKNH